ncbi:hypothetical protein [Maribacter sp. 2304DJ31-5]|uniref:hypothetical protein n=1 Tax=Maribacter sp. 2304DJ31-5 TaxID=3386273 RepID=UPI0039BD7EDC
MTAGQRKAHKFIWLCIVTVIPVILFLAVKDLNFTASNENLLLDRASNGASVSKQIKNNMINVDLMINGNGKVINILLKKPLRSTSSLVYVLENGKRGELLGQLSGVGKYSFETMVDLEGILVYDAIKEVEISKLFF